MKNIIIIVAAFVALGALLFAFNSFIYLEKQADITSDTATAQTEKYTLPEEGMTFGYPAGINGYTVLELPDTRREPMPLRTVRLLPATDYINEQGRMGENSPDWLLSIYTNDQMLQPGKWVDAYPVLSNKEFIIQSPMETVVGGASAVTYRTDGLYSTQVYVIAHANLIYMAQVSFMDERDKTFTEHEAWINSFEFTPIAPTPMSGKLDPKFVCEQSLTYMTFESNEAAEAFVAACVNGEHPEVFEKHINDRGLDGATI